MDVDRDRPYRREAQGVDPCRTLAVTAVIDRFEDGPFVPAVQPIAIDQTWGAIIGNAPGVAGMAIVADAFVLKELTSTLDCRGIFRMPAEG